MAKKTNAARYLETLGIAYELLTYDVDESDLSAPLAADKVGLPPERVYKTLVTIGDKTGVVVACIPSNQELNLKRLSSLSGNKKIELVPLKDVQRLTGYIRGGVSPLGMKKEYPVYMDSSATLHESITVSGGVRGSLLLLKPQDLIRATKATIGGIVTTVHLSE